MCVLLVDRWCLGSVVTVSYSPDIPKELNKELPVGITTPAKGSA